jgi:hypothetical protein
VNRARLPSILLVVLALLATAYYARGAHYLVFGTAPSDAIDLMQRWTEERYFLRGENPFDPWARRAGFPQDNGRKPVSNPDLGVWDPGHPPWGYIVGLAFFWPPWPAVRSYYLALNTAALALIAWWGMTAAPFSNWRWRWVLGLGVVAVGAVSATLGVGQYAILVTALLCAGWSFEARDRPALSGLCVALATVKPTLAGPFYLALVLRRRWKAAFAGGLYIVAGSLIVWAVLATTPWEMLRQLLRVGALYGDQGSANLAGLLIGWGVDRQFATLPAMLLGLAPMALLLYRPIERSVSATYAIAAVSSRLWTYHRTYDDLILIFLFIALACVVTGARPSTKAAVGCAVVGISLWLPNRICEIGAVGWTRAGIWLLALVILVREVVSRDVAASSLAAAGSPRSSVKGYDR